MRKEIKKINGRSTTRNTDQPDLWLNRLSSFSQFGLLIIAIIGYFYTVVPLYQKSVLDEEIAKKEIELIEMQKKLDENYAQLRKLLTGQFIFFVGLECTGMPKKALNFQSANLETELLLHLSNRLKNNGLTCLQNELGKSTRLLQTLKNEDYKLFSNEIDKVGNQIELRRKSAIAEFEGRKKQFEIDGEAEPLISITQAYFNFSKEAIYSLKKLDWSNVKY